MWLGNVGSTLKQAVSPKCKVMYLWKREFSPAVGKDLWAETVDSQQQDSLCYANILHIELKFTFYCLWPCSNLKSGY